MSRRRKKRLAKTVAKMENGATITFSNALVLRADDDEHRGTRIFAPFLAPEPDAN